jgi:hypothetical protein
MSHTQTLLPEPQTRRTGRCRHQPLRDEQGQLRAIIEVAPSATPEQRARFTSLARMLHQLWFIDQPSPLWVNNQPPAFAHTKSINLTNVKDMP